MLVNEGADITREGSNMIADYLRQCKNPDVNVFVYMYERGLKMLNEGEPLLFIALMNR